VVVVGAFVVGAFGGLHVNYSADDIHTAASAGSR